LRASKRHDGAAKPSSARCSSSGPASRRDFRRPRLRVPAIVAPLLRRAQRQPRAPTNSVPNARASKRTSRWVAPPRRRPRPPRPLLPHRRPPRHLHRRPRAPPPRRHQSHPRRRLPLPPRPPRRPPRPCPRPLPPLRRRKTKVRGVRARFFLSSSARALSLPLPSLRATEGTYWRTNSQHKLHQPRAVVGAHPQRVSRRRRAAHTHLPLSRPSLARQLPRTRNRPRPRQLLTQPVRSARPRFNTLASLPLPCVLPAPTHLPINASSVNFGASHRRLGVGVFFLMDLRATSSGSNSTRPGSSKRPPIRTVMTTTRTTSVQHTLPAGAVVALSSHSPLCCCVSCLASSAQSCSAVQQYYASWGGWNPYAAAPAAAAAPASAKKAKKAAEDEEKPPGMD